MPRVIVPLTEITRAGVAPAVDSDGDPVNGHSVANDGRAIVLVRNSGAVSRNLTVQVPLPVDGQSVTPKTFVIPAGASRYIGPFPEAVYTNLLRLDVDNAEIKLSAYRLTTG